MNIDVCRKAIAEADEMLRSLKADRAEICGLSISSGGRVELQLTMRTFSQLFSGREVAATPTASGTHYAAEFGGFSFVAMDLRPACAEPKTVVLGETDGISS